MRILKPREWRKRVRCGTVVGGAGLGSQASHSGKGNSGLGITTLWLLLRIQTGGEKRVWGVGKAFLITLGIVFRATIFKPEAAEFHPGNRGKGPSFCWDQRRVWQPANPFLRAFVHYLIYWNKPAREVLRTFFFSF